MNRKPEIQYIGQFYVHGSEARELELLEKKKRAKTKLPAARMENIRKVYVDPVALCGIAVAVVMLVIMVLGAIQIKAAWNDYEQVSGYLTELNQDNVRMNHIYRSTVDLAEIETKALALGMVPVGDVETMTVRVTVPEPEPETTWWDDLLWFLDGLLE